MFYAKHRSRRRKMKFVKGIAMLLCFVTIFTSVWVGNIGIGAEDGNGTVTVTVNYVYESNKAMVAQPYTAQVVKGSEFVKTLDVPGLFNYTIPADKAQGLGNGVELSVNDQASPKKYQLSFNIESIETDITVTLYYVAGQAKYTVNHHYQNVEDNEYGETVTVELLGDIDAYTNATANNRNGYHCKGINQGTVAADGKTTVDIYYDRNYYTVVFDVNGGVGGSEPIYAKYGTQFNAKDIKEPNRKGYEFLGWQPLLSDTVTITGDVTYVAQWQPEKGQADYTIVLWGQNANDNEYSYLGSYEAWGNVGNQVTWKEETLISHVHTDDCWELTCGKENHTHNDRCLSCGKTEYTHSAKCYPGGSDVVVETYFSPRNPKNGQIYIFDIGIYKKSVVYFNGSWYEYNGSAKNGDIINMNCGKTEHTHSIDCYTCGKTEHTHDSSCGTLKCGLSDTPKKHMGDLAPDSKLWKYVRSDTVTVKADGTTVLNVYFDRTEFTLTFKYGRNNSQTEIITDRWGANVKSRFDAIEDNATAKEYGNLTGWKDSTTNYYTNNVMVMPSVNKTFTAHYANSTTLNTMKYYSADLNGEYKEIFTIEFYGDGYTVTADEYYEWEGFEINKEKSSKPGASCRNAEFYYDRKTYKLEFYSASNSVADIEYDVKYQNPLSRYDYTPTAKPETVEPDAVFVGWYLNPECTGEQFDLTTHVMPANDIALYARWVNGLYTVKTYTDESKTELYKYDGYDGERTNIVKYTTTEAPNDPTKEGYMFAGWFYKDGEQEKPFSFTMPITRDYDLYPKFTNDVVVKYTVHFYVEGTTEKVADDVPGEVRIGSNITVKAKMGTELFADYQNKYFPEISSKGFTVNGDGQEFVIYYKQATEVKYKVFYQDKYGNNLIDPVVKTTGNATVTESYVAITNYAPRMNQITLDLSSDESKNVIVFVYDPTLTTLKITKSGAEDIDENQSFLFVIKGAETDENTKGIELTVTIPGNGSVTIADLPVGSYTVTEKTDWSWRYQPESETQNVVLKPDGGSVVFNNKRSDDKWLSGDAYKVNDFN